MKFQILLLLMLLAAACTPQSHTPGEPGSQPPDTAVTSPPADEVPTNGPHENPFSPKPGDEQLSRGDAYVSATNVSARPVPISEAFRPLRSSPLP